MRVAELLSDLTSLRACDPQAALALVSARPAQANDVPTSGKPDDGDEDLKRARDLIELHSTVKTRHGSGVDDELLKARRDVDRVLDAL